MRNATSLTAQAEPYYLERSRKRDAEVLGIQSILRDERLCAVLTAGGWAVMLQAHCRYAGDGQFDFDSASTCLASEDSIEQQHPTTVRDVFSADSTWFEDNWTFHVRAGVIVGPFLTGLIDPASQLKLHTGFTLLRGLLVNQTRQATIHAASRIDASDRDRIIACLPSDEDMFATHQRELARQFHLV